MIAAMEAEDSEDS